VQGFDASGYSTVNLLRSKIVAPRRDLYRIDTTPELEFTRPNNYSPDER
jgi:hypothetical protein